MKNIGLVLISLILISVTSCGDEAVSDVTCDTAGWICLGGSDQGGSGGGGPAFITVTPTFSLTAGIKSILVSWTAIDGATRYLVFYSTSSSGPFTQLVVSAPSTSTTLEGLTADQAYSVYIQGGNDSGLRTLASAIKTATPTAAP
jgi:hypothetical protein